MLKGLCACLQGITSQVAAAKAAASNGVATNGVAANTVAAAATAAAAALAEEAHGTPALILYGSNTGMLQELSLRQTGMMMLGCMW